MDEAHYNNIIFPHEDRDGLCGFEIKNKGFTGFSEGGTKGLWFSNIFKSDTRLVIAETAIDALSFHCLNPDPHTRYCSIGGKMNPSQPALITGAVSKMPEGSEIIIATDADTAGRMMAGKIEHYVQAAQRDDITLTRAEPPEEGADWNDQLRTVRSLMASNDHDEAKHARRSLKLTR